MIFKSRHVSASISRPTDEVYDFSSNPENLPLWASGLSGAIKNPMRVFPNNDGSELVFTLYQRPGMSDNDFTSDEEQIKSDLARLKTLIENQSA